MKKNSSTSAEPKAGVSQAALAWAVETGHEDDLLRHMNAAVRRTRQRRVIAAATSAVVVVVAGFLWRLPDVEPPNVRPVSTVVLRPAQRALSDGSVVELKENAIIAEQFQSGVRRVILQSGEAHFAVVSDVTRPFVVVAGGIEVRAVGTSFVVGLGPQTVDVVVTEGRVAVEKRAVLASEPSSAPVVHVDAGNRMVVGREPEAGAISSEAVPLTGAALNERLSWRVPRLEFSSTPLSEAIPMFGQHARVEIIFDPALGVLQMSGVLRADNIDALLRLLQDEFGIEAERRDAKIILRRR